MRFYLAVILAIFFVSAAHAERRVALILAADDYRNVRPLKNAVNDSRTIESALKKLGFDVTTEANRDLKRMRRALEDFRDDAAGADVALIYFSGHGVEIAGDNRLLPVDADPSSLDRLKATTLLLEEVRETVTAVGKIGLVVLDACRNDPFGQSGGSESGDSKSGEGRGVVSIAPEVKGEAKPGLGRMGRAENVLFAFSAAPGQTASDGASGNSEFSAALARFLPTDGLEIRSVLTLVQQQVYDLSRGKQLPYVESGLPQLFFAAQASKDALPERDRLLLAMADVTPDLRVEVEAVAAKADMPLAPLYAALITSGGKAMAPRQRQQKLQEAADAFTKVRTDLRNFASSDPQVTALRQQAEAQLALGSFDEARALLGKAADIDGKSRDDLKTRFIERTLSEATTHYLAGGASQAQLRYDLAIEDYRKAVALYADVEGFHIPDDARYQQTLSWELIGTLETTVGHLQEAGKAYDSMVRSAEKRAAAEPDKIDHQRDLVVAQNKVADVKKTMGDSAGAIALYEQALATMKAIVEKQPTLGYLRDYAVCFNRIGDAMRISGDGPGALANYRSALKVAEFLVEKATDDDGFRRDLSVSHSKVGLALRLTNDLQSSIAEYDVSLQITEALAKKTPDDAELQRDISVSLNAIGDLQRLTGHNEKAFELYQRSVEIGRKLVSRDPGNTLWRRDLELALGKVADARNEAGDLDGALANHRSAQAIADYLAELDPDNAEWQRDLAVGHNRIGDALMSKGAKVDAAAEYQAGFAIANAQLQADPGNAQRTVDAAYSRYKLAVAGVDPSTNLKAALAMLTGLKSQGRLPGANEGWIGMIEKAMAGAGFAK
ncbi:caspase domain-containing protein [Mesorhizobium qingshengii]|uniref:Caspase domain-containing protein n=1 Tax=Mesorhizobium qingshengii TaxID=1165689 RepID=A0ABT4QWK6_9HYPH|nr:caspase domain-containing protein [Mesorhizobium qingshengii]MCZ8545948.1 caspase domain-containing protein [Mesorhizobium qingshengii]